MKINLVASLREETFRGNEVVFYEDLGQLYVFVHPSQARSPEAALNTRLRTLCRAALALRWRVVVVFMTWKARRYHGWVPFTRVNKLYPKGRGRSLGDGVGPGRDCVQLDPEEFGLPPYPTPRGGR